MYFDQNKHYLQMMYYNFGNTSFNGKISRRVASLDFSKLVFTLLPTDYN